MIATDFHLIPLAQLCRLEETVLERFDSLPIRYAENLLEEPEIRYPFLYYALLTHWPELLGDLSTEDVFYNRYYWFLRLSKKYRINHDFDDEFEWQITQMLELAPSVCDPQLLQDIEKKVSLELATNEMELAVAFSNFSISKVLDEFSLELKQKGDLFKEAHAVEISSLLQETLKWNVPMALAMGSEKARSELIIAPVLCEVYRQLSDTISLFSGAELDVDAGNGLRGVCDFLLCQSPDHFVIQAPIVAIVEVKKADTNAGIGQCIAEMVAARIFNQQKGNDIPAVFGVVTSGSNWRFLRLVDSTAYIDVSEYHIKEVERIVGIIVSMFKSSGTPNTA